MSERMQQPAIEAEAAEFFLRLRDPSDRTRSAADFSEWLTRSPTHVESFLSIVAAWSAIDLANASAPSSEALIAAARAEVGPGNVVSLNPLQELTPPRSAARRTWWAAAAMLLVALAGWGGYAYLGGLDTYRNMGSEVRRVTLADGSAITLGPSSEIRLHWTSVERRLELRRGWARFQVARNVQRPFLVDTALGTVRAVGTVFDVDAQQQQTRVTVIEGIVSVQSSTAGAAGADAGDSVQLMAGDHATITQDAAASGHGVERSVMAWTSQRVVFRGAPLGAVVDEFNRYRAHPVIIDDSELAVLAISGVFDPRNPDSLLSYLQLYESVQVDYAADGSVLLSRRTGAAEVAPGTRGARH